MQTIECKYINFKPQLLDKYRSLIMGFCCSLFLFIIALAGRLAAQVYALSHKFMFKGLTANTENFCS